MTPIVFNDIANLSDEGRSVEERNGIADKVYTEHGIEGLLTLWACQDYYDPTDTLDTGLTPATDWWLLEGNTYAKIVKEQLSKLNEDDALALLKKATFAPLVEMHMWGGRNEGHMKLFTPEEPDTFSHASASTVRRIAGQFFPQYPMFTTALCSIYLDVGESDPDILDNSDLEPDVYAHHTKTLEAFEDDSTALQYLIRVHKAPSAQRLHASPEIIALLSQTDGEWAMYDNMGISPEEAYNISKSLRVPPAVLPLPAEFSM